MANKDYINIEEVSQLTWKKKDYLRVKCWTYRKNNPQTRHEVMKWIKTASWPRYLYSKERIKEEFNLKQKTKTKKDTTPEKLLEKKKELHYQFLKHDNKSLKQENKRLRRLVNSLLTQK